MRVSLDWLQQLVPHGQTPEALARLLTFAGLEVEAIERLAPAFQGVVVGRITECTQHPDADKLRVCKVDVADGTQRQIVCGAPNARVGLVAPVALVGAALPGGLNIKAAKLRGVESQGMLCSAKELGLDEDASGLMELASDAPLGVALSEALALDDTVLALKVTPNRGDCQSMLGVAREVAVLTGTTLRLPDIGVVPASTRDELPVVVEAPADCPRYVGRLVRGIRTDARSPTWLVERLRRAGLRAIHPVVDITNYVMLELGQPMHGFDAATLAGGVVVRHGRAGERLTLLDGREVEVDASVLMICDQARVRALGGVMGGIDSGVSAATTDVYFESAWFRPTSIAGRARRFGLHTDAAQRFERGVDPAGQVRAMERATALLLAIAGGSAGPVTVTESPAELPVRRPIGLRAARIGSLLGMTVPGPRVTAILDGLGCAVSSAAEGWQATPPSHRFDLEREEDLVEEVGRVHGYEHIQPARYPAATTFLPAPETRVPLSRLSEALVDRGYAEAITYSFVDPVLQAQVLGPDPQRVRLANPIAADLAELRASLLPGLLGALRWNLARQQTRVRLFEHGIKFSSQPDVIKEINVIGGIATGPVHPSQWGLSAAEVGFADGRGDVEAVLAAAGVRGAEWHSASHPALHPGQTAEIRLDGQVLGWVGCLHPRLIKDLDLPTSVVAFELELAPLRRPVPKAAVPSRFPAIQRDIAVVVDEGVTAAEVLAVIRDSAGALLEDLQVFDVYRGKGIEAGRKSLAMSLILQDSSRTLTDEETETVMTRVLGALSSRLGAQLRT
jgi:phenylalanyl-tRNA synthetase beta chain